MRYQTIFNLCLALSALTIMAESRSVPVHDMCELDCEERWRSGPRVCGSDGVTYDELCHPMTCMGPGVTIVHDGPCQVVPEVPLSVESDCGLLCGFWDGLHNPAFGSRSEAYATGCFQTCIDSTRTASDEGMTECISPLAYLLEESLHNDLNASVADCELLCSYWTDLEGYNLRHYADHCYEACLEAAGTIEGSADNGGYVDELIIEDPCEMSRGYCERGQESVCASNGATFDDICYLECVAPNLTVAHMGACEDEGFPEVIDFLIEDPCEMSRGHCERGQESVCASNGATYTDICYLECVAPNLTVAHMGACEDEDNNTIID